MQDNMSFSSIEMIIKAWERAKNESGFSEKVGIDILERLIELDPNISVIFGFDGSSSSSKSIGLRKMGLLIHGKRVVDMIELTFGVLGPDRELQESFLADLGQRHHHLGVKPKQLQLFSDAIRDQMKAILGTRWSIQLEEAWTEVFSVVLTGIVRGMPRGVLEGS